MEKEKNTLVKGLWINEKKENTPDFVIERLSFKVEDFEKFLNENKNEKGYVNIDILASKGGKHYATLNDFKREETNKVEELKQNVEQAGAENLPF